MKTWLQHIDDSGAKIFIYNETETSQRTDFKTQIKRAIGGLFNHLGDVALYNTAVKSITG